MWISSKRLLASEIVLKIGQDENLALKIRLLDQKQEPFIITYKSKDVDYGKRELFKQSRRHISKETINKIRTPY